MCCDTDSFLIYLFLIFFILRCHEIDIRAPGDFTFVMLLCFHHSTDPTSTSLGILLIYVITF